MTKNSFILLAIFVTFAFSACDSDFSSFEEIDAPRVIAITADLPDTFPGETVTFTPIVVADPENLTTHSWEACISTSGPNSYFECDPSFGGVLLQEDGPTFSVPIMITNDDLNDYCAMLAQEDVPFGVTLPSCEDGIPLTIRLHSSFPEGNDQISIRTIYVRHSDQINDRNEIPELLGLSIDEIPLEIGGQTSIPLSTEELPLQVVVAPDAMEVFFSENDSQENETLELSWFTSHGELEDPTSFFTEGLSEEEFLKNTLTLSDADISAISSGERFDIVLVLRDDRNGVSGLEFEISSQ